MILTLAAWAATAAILLTYAVSTVRSEWVRKFDIANAAGFLPLLALNATLHAWPAAAINLGFGVPALAATWRHTVRPRLRLREISRTDELDPWCGARPFKGIDIITDPFCPPGQMFLINKDNIKQLGAECARRDAAFIRNLDGS